MNGVLSVTIESHGHERYPCNICASGRRVTEPCLHMLQPEAQQQSAHLTTLSHCNPYTHINLKQVWRQGGPPQTKALCRVSLLQVTHSPAGAQI